MKLARALVLSALMVMVGLFGGAGSSRAQIPVTDGANLGQNILHFAQRLIEVVQKYAQLQALIDQLEQGSISLTDLVEDPHLRGVVLGEMDYVDELMLYFEALADQEQALSFVLESVGPEFDLTFPGTVGFGELGADGGYTIETGAGVRSFASPAEFLRYQRGRLRQGDRQLLNVLRRQNGVAKTIEAFLSFGETALTQKATGALGHMQALEYLLAATGLNSQAANMQLNATSTRTNSELVARSFELNLQMMAEATNDEVVEQWEVMATELFGSEFPDPNDSPPASPFPDWGE